MDMFRLLLWIIIGQCLGIDLIISCLYVLEDGQMKMIIRTTNVNGNADSQSYTLKYKKSMWHRNRAPVSYMIYALSIWSSYDYSYTWESTVSGSR